MIEETALAIRRLKSEIDPIDSASMLHHFVYLNAVYRDGIIRR